MNSETIMIERKYNGPPDSGQGGYVCGVIANRIGVTAEVTLRAPPPLEKPLELVLEGDRTVRLLDGGKVVGEGAPASLTLEIPQPPSLTEARQAAEIFPGFKDHTFPTCYACGHHRGEGDGLRIFSGPVPGRNLVAAPWTPHPGLADEEGWISREQIWAALDCPSGWAVAIGGHFDKSRGEYILLGRMTAQVLVPLESGRTTIAFGWPIDRDGRKLFTGTAIVTPEGETIAAATATWILMGTAS